MSKVKSYLWTLSGKFSSQLLFLITNVFLARLLTPEDFGTIGVVSIIISVATTLSDTGLGGALMLEKKLTKENCGTVFVFNFVVSITLFLIVFICSPFIENFYRIKGLSLVVKLLSLVFVIHAISIVPKNILVYQLRFKECTFITILSVIISSFCSIIMAYSGAGVYSLVAYQIIQALVSAILLYWRSNYKLRITFDKKIFKRLFEFGIFTTSTSIVDSIYENLITSVFGKFVNVSHAGYFFQSKKLEEASTRSLMATINSTTYPILSKIRDNKTQFVKDASLLQKNIILLLTPFLIFLGVYSDEVVLIIYGPHWIDAAPYLSVLLVAGFFMITESLNRSFIKSLGEVRKLFYFTLLKRIMGILMIISLAFVSIKYMLVGYVLSAVIGFLTNIYVYSMIINTSFFRLILKDILLFIFLSCLLSIVLLQHHFVGGYYGMSITIVIYVIYYFLILPLWGINVKKLLKLLTKS